MGKYEDRATAHAAGIVADGQEADADITELELQVTQSKQVNSALATRLGECQATSEAQATKIAQQADVMYAQETEIARLQAIIDGDTPPDPPPDPPVDPPVPPKTKMLYGYSHANRAKLEADTKVLVCADRAYETGIPVNQDATVAKGLLARYVPIVSFKVDWKAAAGGSHDAAFEKYLRSITRPTIVIMGHEPENDGKSPADFKAAQNRLMDVAKRVANANVTMAINLMSSWINKPAGQRSEDYIVTGRTDYILSWDGYTHDKTTTPAVKFAPALALNKKYGLRFGLGETANEVDAARWVTAVTDWCASVDAVFCCYWPSITSDAGANQYYPPSSAFPAFAAAALKYGGTKTP